MSQTLREEQDRAYQLALEKDREKVLQLQIIYNDKPAIHLNILKYLVTH